MEIDGVLDLSGRVFGSDWKDHLTKFKSSLCKNEALSVKRLKVRMSASCQAADVGLFASHFENLEVLDISGSICSIESDFESLFFALRNKNGFLLMLNTPPLLPTSPNLPLLSFLLEQGFLERVIWMSEFVSSKSELWEVLFSELPVPDSFVSAIKQAHTSFYSFSTSCRALVTSTPNKIGSND